jgi:superfamily II DNA or RNA helicase
MTSPTHPKTRSYLQRGLFDWLTSFRELEGRISGLATRGERGNAFEIFAEAYLATVAVEKAEHVWPGASVPYTLLKRLRLTIGDKGVDGIFETQLGEHHAYQAKFRTGRPSLTWDELSTFVGLADQVDQRVLITNCDRFADVLEQRSGFYAITGNDLDKLEPQDFAVIRGWLEGARIERQPKSPLPHQAQAIQSLLSALRDRNRATALMACGSGKTLVALWVAEHMAVQNILVLVPSLALLRQTLHEWARETSWKSFAHLCVCCDPTVKPDSDELLIRPTDLDFPVTTNGAQVREFLTATFDGAKLVFSTYQSAHVVAAGMKRGDAFDLAIFDEAHKTAAREGVHFSFALSDKHLPIKKRLFLTATPRHYDIRQRDKEGDARLVYSMDAPEVYGPVAYKLTFAEAARRGIICNYKVIISVVTSDMVNDHLLRHGEVIVKGDAVKARHVANQLALQAAVTQHDIRKVFTFHRSIASAAAFTSDGSAGIGNHLSGFDAFHVNGAMPTSERENIMTEFRAASKALISNARCLTEGVDVPVVDMVAFLTPKRSRVDIVQATGRAMRKAHGKTTGYILVPLFVEQAKGETIEEALARTEFDEVWNVLQAMQEQDDMLAEIIREMREERGRTSGFDDSRFRERVEFLGPQISLKLLRNSITTACIEALGEDWDERFGQLKAFKQRFGHCKVPEGWEENKQLATWIAVQRTRRKQNKLSQDRIFRLESVGFVWAPHTSMWDEMFERLSEYKKNFGHTNVPARWTEDSELGMWVSMQRRLHKKSQLSNTRVKRLDEIEFLWDPLAARWEEMFSALQGFKRDHGHCDVPIGWTENPQLAYWVHTQRRVNRQGKLPADRFTRLDRLGFAWEVTDDRWEEMFCSLVDYRKTYGDCNVPRAWSENPRLGVWVHTLRKQKRLGELNANRIQRLNRRVAELTTRQIQRLDALAFEWNPVTSAWEKMFKALVDFRTANGNCDVPQCWQGSSQLWTWVSHQRRRYYNGLLGAAKARRLEKLGLVWKPAKERWEKYFAALIEYKDTFGNCNVPQDWQGNPSLGRWVGQQRFRRSTGKLSAERIQRLNSIGFHWNTTDSRWETMFAALIEYRQRFGNCNVPHEWSESAALGGWVSLQRTRRKRGQISARQLQKLNSLGFVWDIRDGFWEERFSELVQYKQQVRDTLVPLKWPENPQLGAWVANQRVRKKHGTLSKDRISRLSKIGFHWKGTTNERKESS